MDERKRDSIVAYLKNRMAEFGITPEAIAASLAEDHQRLLAIRYRDASGNSWDGKDAPPRWVVQAMSAGQSLEHFAVSDGSSTNRPTIPAVDWRDDPFAGSRLATVRPASFETA